MQNLNLFTIFTDKLVEGKIEYVVTGSVAVYSLYQSNACQ